MYNIFCYECAGESCRRVWRCDKRSETDRLLHDAYAEPARAVKEKSRGGVRVECDEACGER